MPDPPDQPTATATPDMLDLRTSAADSSHHTRPSGYPLAASQAADHLATAAQLLRQVPGRDAILLAAPRTADVLSALRHAAPYCGGALPSFDLLDTIHGLRTWPLSMNDHGPQRPKLRQPRHHDEQAS